MTQHTLDFTPSTRKGHPQTSRAAATRAKYGAGKTARKVLECLADGIARTDEEIYAAIGASPYISSPRARRADMVGMGLIEAQDNKGKSSSGCTAQRWAITSKGLDTIESLAKQEAAR